MAIEDLFSVKGKVVLVTGGCRGIGLMIASGFVDRGARVYISARDEPTCAASAAELAKRGECHPLLGDISRSAGVEDLSRQLLGREERLHVLVNNAGVSYRAPIEEYSDEGFGDVLAVNLRAPFQLVRKMLPALRRAASREDPARVINIGSVDGLRVPQLNSFAYSSSKAAIHMLTRHLGAILAPDHITVNAIAPGVFPTRMTAFRFEVPGGEEQVRAMIPLDRPGRPDDLAGTAIYLASRAGAYVTGSVIPVSGGIATVR